MVYTFLNAQLVYAIAFPRLHPIGHQNPDLKKNKMVIIDMCNDRSNSFATYTNHNTK
jgi:hypothetical protein